MKKRIVITAIVMAIVASLCTVWSSAAATSLDPKVDQIYFLTGTAVSDGAISLSAQCDEQGDFGITHYALESGTLKTMEYDAANRTWWYAHEGATAAATFNAFAWGANSTCAMILSYAYPVQCLEAPVAGTIEVYFNGASEPANIMEFFITKNGVEESKKVTLNDEHKATVEVKKGDKLYFHSKPVGAFTDGAAYGAPAAYFSYSAIDAAGGSEDQGPADTSDVAMSLVAPAMLLLSGSGIVLLRKKTH